jgi:hypothetical protein
MNQEQAWGAAMRDLQYHATQQHARLRTRFQTALMMMWLLAVESRLSPVHHLSVPNAQASFKLTADFSVHSSASAFATLPNKFTTLFQEGNLTCIVFFSILQNVNHVNKIQPILNTLRLIISGEAFVQRK